MCNWKRLSRTVYYIHGPIGLLSNWLISDGFFSLRCGQRFMFKGSLFPERYIFGVLGQLYCMIVEHIKAVVVIVIFIYNHKCTTMKPVLSGAPISGHPLLSGH